MTLVPLTNRSHFGLTDRLWSDAFNHLLESQRAQSSSWAPAVDIHEEENHYVVKADIPGIDPKDIEITMEEGTLTIQGERVSSLEDSDKGVHRIERSYGSFVRKFSFPNNVDVDGIQASGKDGVLVINLPKQESAKVKKIEVS
jgi:HSP20 family protein